MLLHFIFVIKEEELDERKQEFEYVKQMANFFQVWIKQKFSKDFEIKCDQMITKPRSILQKLDIHVLQRDHRERGKEIYHFYLTHFRPIWTDCAGCEGFHSENFGMALWQKPKVQNDTLFLAEKNCTVVSHEICHEMLRVRKYKRYIEDVHEIWTQHLFNNLPFEQYNENFSKTDEKPKFLTMDTSSLTK
tara:strand:+ start:690 stop:1259 length:570 start_codon:yes stop_codon:yes gene_type:complete